MPRRLQDLIATVVRVLALVAAAGALVWSSDTGVAAATTGAARFQQAPETTRPRIVALGDSLTAGLGLPQTQAYPAVLQQYVDAERLNYEVVNAGVSGDTSAGGLSRLDWSLQGNVSVLVLALGANDGLRGLSVEGLRRNLATMIETAQSRKIRVVLTGMEAPPNFGQTYTVSFRKVFPDLAKQYKVPLVPFLLQGVAGIERLNQRDGIHPTAEGAKMLAANVWAVLRPMLKG